VAAPSDVHAMPAEPQPIASIATSEPIPPRAPMALWLDSLLVDHGLLRLVYDNFAVVSPGRLYRAGHPSPGRLAVCLRRHGIRTVISLRGVCTTGSDTLSREAAARLGLDHIDAPLRSREAPPREAVQNLLDVFAAMREPALVHCKSGIDRSGFAAALFLLANGADSVAALGQLSLRFGHLANSRAGVLRAFLQRYATEAEGRKPFRAWLAEDYDAAALQRDFVAGRLASLVHDSLLGRE
jgi:protein tyrosine/serine phosphatase